MTSRRAKRREVRGEPEGEQTRTAGTGPAEQLPEQLQSFREMLFDLSARLMSVPPHQIADEIELGLRQTGEFWGLDAIVLTEASDDGLRREVAAYRSAGAGPLPSIDFAREIPWAAEAMRAGSPVPLAGLGDGPSTGARSGKRYLTKHGFKSALLIPCGRDRPESVAISVLSVTRDCPWPPELVTVLLHLGKILTGALERKRVVERIEEMHRFEHLLSDVSATYINLPRDDVEKVLMKDFDRLGRLLGVDRCVLYRVGEDKRFSGSVVPFVWSPDEDADSIRKLDEWSSSVPNPFEGLQFFFDKWYVGECVQWTRLEELPPEAERVKQLYGMFGVRSGIAIPVSVAGSTIAALVITTVRACRSWPEELISRLRLFGEVFANALMRKKNEEEIQHALSEIKQLKERIEADYTYLKEEISLGHDFGDIVGKSDSLKRILIKAKQVAPTHATVLLLGETGTGKGLIARAIHETSTRKDRPFMQVNCAALNPGLIESELFGHEKGAFTGAAVRRVGRFEAAHGTTLFLDEIGDLPPELQPKLLRVLQGGEFERLGGSATLKVDVRVIAATNRDLEREVEEGRFRRDLWYRLSIFPISVPPLRERLEDIPLFVSSFVRKYGKWMGKEFKMVPQKTIRALQEYAWPGNIRELENLIERAVITSPDGNLQIELPSGPGVPVNTGKTLEDVEREHILKVLQETGWTIEGPNGAARRLGLKASTLRFRARKLGITRPRKA